MQAWGFEKVRNIYEVQFTKYDLLSSKGLIRIQQIAGRNSKFVDGMSF